MAHIQDKGEIESFKSKINLVEYAQANGYTVDRRESSHKSKIMRHENGDKIVVATDKDGHGIYFSVRNDRDKGTIIDFVQTRRGMNLGQVRQELRPWIGLGREPQRPHAPDPKPLPTYDIDAQQMPREFARTTSVERHAYLEQRGITPATLQDQRFKGMVRQDHHGNAVFPHYSHGELTGYELKNNGFTGFSKGGSKGVWVSNNFSTAKEIVITESAIDALSHAQLNRTGNETAYLSVGGEISRRQEHLISSLMEHSHRLEAQITIATDNDRAGHKLARSLQELAPRGVETQRCVPPQGKDFNELLQIRTREQARDRDRSWSMERSMSRGH